MSRRGDGGGERERKDEVKEERLRGKKERGERDMVKLRERGIENEERWKKREVGGEEGEG